MIWRLFRRRSVELETGVEHAEKQLSDARAKGAEVTELSLWARERRERNHLSEMFYGGRARGSNG